MEICEINIWSIINSTSTIIVTIIAILTLFEVYRQRLTTYRPELILRNQDFKIVRNAKFKIPTIWNNEIIKADIINYSIIEEAEMRIKYELGILNIGLGAAKNIKVDFSYNTKALVAEILKLDKNNELGLTFDNTHISFDPKEENFLLYKGILIPYTNAKRELDYVQPISVDKSEVYVELPLDYLFLCSVLIYFKLINEKYKNIHSCFPNLKMTLLYSDIGNRKYKKDIELDFESYGTSAHSTTGKIKVKYK